MRQQKSLYSLLEIILLLSLLTVFISCFAPVFSDLQNAKLLGPGKIEVTPSFSTVSYSSEGESGHLQNHFGIQGGVGIFSLMDFRLRYEYINVDTNGGDPFHANILGFGPKFKLIKDVMAFYVPVGFAFSEDIETADTWQVHPTLLTTLRLNKYIEFNPSAKILIPFKSEQSTLVAFNLGIGLSADLDRWAVRPEIGFLLNPGESGYYWHLSLGFSLLLHRKNEHLKD